MPLTTPDIPPAKRKKKDPSCLQISPVVPATATAGWASLPDDLVRRIADSFLATNDVDCYMDFRAVCPSWRAATDDPKTNTSDPRFFPRAWIVLDEVFQSDDRRILLNTNTGRFLRKKIPLLLDYYVVATTSGFFVLADRSPPHAARVFNPLTGYTLRFMVPMPPDVRVAFVGSWGRGKASSPLCLVLLGDLSCKLYTTVPDSEGVLSYDYRQEVYNFFRKVIVGGAYPHIAGLGFAPAFAELLDLLRSLHADFVKVFFNDLPEDANDIRFFLVGLAIHMVLVIKIQGTLFVFKMNTELGKVEPLQSISNFAIFIGHRRCLPVDATKFPGIEANCVYYTEHLGLSAHICKYNIKDKKVERISEAPEFVKQDKQFVLVAHRPFTTIQLLCSYTINTLDSQLALQQMSEGVEASRSNSGDIDLDD
ncbi:uncharacterized protein LOC124668509 [Lolium rigidum]|uniref:uncharacterized protein LOC124668509 n=1 Tax=Lolium rigidum TaxID=89674 RepID=UPI001F5C96AD|nr:uncharacterized protein LOC124668509 [Lolium rigidum]